MAAAKHISDIDELLVLPLVCAPAQPVQRWRVLSASQSWFDKTASGEKRRLVGRTQKGSTEETDVNVAQGMMSRRFPSLPWLGLARLSHAVIRFQQNQGFRTAGGNTSWSRSMQFRLGLISQNDSPSILHVTFTPNSSSPISLPFYVIPRKKIAQHDS
jgi:hypothetical protein